MDWSGERLEKVKVGEIRAALEGVHDDVRVADVPAFQALLNEPLQAWKLGFFESAGRMWALLDRLSLAFSQKADSRDLALAKCLSEHAGSFSALLRVYKLELPARLPVCENVGEAIDEAVAESAASGLHNLAEALETLRRGIDGREDDMKKGKSMLQAILAAKVERAVGGVKGVSAESR